MKFFMSFFIAGKAFDSKQIFLFTVKPVFVLFAVVANHIAASPVCEPTPALFHLFDNTRGVTATATQSGTVVGTETLPAFRDGTESRWLLKIEKLFIAGILKRFAETNAGKTTSIESCSYRNHGAALSVCRTTWCFRERKFPDRLMVFHTKYSWRCVETAQFSPACLHAATARNTWKVNEESLKKYSVINVAQKNSPWHLHFSPSEFMTAAIPTSLSWRNICVDSSPSPSTGCNSRKFLATRLPCFTLSLQPPHRNCFVAVSGRRSFAHWQRVILPSAHARDIWYVRAAAVKACTNAVSL